MYNNNNNNNNNIDSDTNLNNMLNIENSLNETNINETNKNDENTNVKTQLKKRGRKPKGGKIISQQPTIINNKIEKPNIILHLKCFKKDLNNINNSNILSYNSSNLSNNQIINDSYILNNTKNNDNNKVIENEENSSNINKEIWKKLKLLEHQLHINDINNKKSACFFCTYDFDNPIIYIPKYYIKNSYHVYGCFCSPECAVAYLMNENLDSSTKFERYHLLNYIYTKIFDYKKNIKPAPNPYYMLNKFYGNLTIQEYRALLNNERLFLIIDKPLTKILPELHEDNDEFILNNKIIPSNNYNIKQKIYKKNNILNKKFGVSSIES